MPLDFNSDVDFVDQDNRYMDQLYALQPGRFDAYRDWAQANLSTELDNYTLPAGKVVMLGTWNGDLYSILKNKYGSENCKGFDIVSYYDDSTTTIGDFRTIHSSHSYDVALVYNAMGTWENNGSSKLAGLQWANTNLVTGGYYLEQYTPNAQSRIPQTATEGGLTYVGSITDTIDDEVKSRLLVFRK